MKLLKLTPYLLILLLICSISSYAQESILKLNNSKKYEVFFVDVSNSNQTNYRIDSIKNFFIVKWSNTESFRIEDKPILEELKKSWTGKKTEEFSFCWYDYFAYVIENEKIVDELRISEKCKQVVSYKGVYKNVNPMLATLDKSSRISVARLDFKSVPVGRTFFNDAKTRTGIFIPEGPHSEWLRFDGKLTISVEDEDSLKTLKRITLEMQKKFPVDSFEIKPSRLGPGYLLADIYCNKEFEEKLSDFKSTSKWEELNPGIITLISTSEQRIQDLVKKYATLND